jgi:LAGLIDADG-like domain
MEQRFLSYSGGSTLAWRRLETMIRPYREGKKAALASWIPPWQPKASFDGGWLAGMFDGEGSLSKRKRDGSSLVLVISQNAGPVLEHVKCLLTADGFQYNCYPANGQKSVHNLGLRGGTREFFRFLGSYRPRSLLAKLVASDCDLELWLAPDPIVDITTVGIKDLIDIQTREGTYFANGFAVHN